MRVTGADKAMLSSEDPATSSSMADDVSSLEEAMEDPITKGNQLKKGQKRTQTVLRGNLKSSNPCTRNQVATTWTVRAPQPFGNERTVPDIDQGWLASLVAEVVAKVAYRVEELLKVELAPLTNWVAEIEQTLNTKTDLECQGSQQDGGRIKV
ncbi:hypothetical protein NDU88_006266 [Pleurodeles waltl]|uniref:Uncharacterized protein n=1 Tax=Pleurodeles waltl TaxID=8319 RepID=A0AAV7PQ59_PLEWA|nr:hypothetical protein NDU88_006266 [Pleurodeles waltl]